MTATTYTAVCGATLIYSDGHLMIGTPCCGATATGSETETGVACRACYNEVAEIHGDYISAGDPDRRATVKAWSAEVAPRFNICSDPDGCAVTAIWNLTQRDESAQEES
jgi:hypothetical protein